MASKSLPTALHLRPATKHDLDDILGILVAGLPDDPACDYQYPYRHLHPGENEKWLRRKFDEHLDQPEKFTVLVVTIPVKSGEGEETGSKPVSVAVWDMDVEMGVKGGDMGLTTRPDIHSIRFQTRAAALRACRQKHFSEHGSRVYHLLNLITHPDFRKCGAGTLLTRWGMQKADEKGYRVSLFAAPMGKPLYERLGFRVLERVRVKVEGEEEVYETDCMEYVKKEGGEKKV